MDNLKHIRLIELSKTQEDQLKAGDTIELPFNDGQWICYGYTTDNFGFEVVHLRQI